MKSYPTNFKKALELSGAREGEQYQCANGIVVRCIPGLGPWFAGSVVTIPERLQVLRQPYMDHAVWEYDGSKYYADRWPPGSNIVRKL